MNPPSQITTSGSAFLKLVACSFCFQPKDAFFSEFQEKLDAIKDETEFDLFLWSLAHRCKIDSEEMLRQLGERWLLDLAEQGSLSMYADLGTIAVLERFLTGGSLASAPIPGIAEFRVDVVSSREEMLKLSCRGSRRCCSFLEGVVRGIAEGSGETIRYLRQPKSGLLVDIVFTCFSR